MRRVKNLPEPRPLVVGHRGAPLEFLENTKDSFQRAMDLHADMIELDVQETATGEVVVFHDETLKRLAHNSEEIKKTSWQELNGIDIQSFNNKKFGKEKIPLFSDVLKMLNHRILLDVEIKGLELRKTDLVVQVVRLIEEMNLEDRVIISSYNFMALVYVHQMNRRIRTAFLTDYPNFYFAIEAFIPPKYRPYGLVFYFRRTDERVLKRAQRDYMVMVFTVDEEDDMKRFIRWGVDGIITNRPKLLRRLVDDWRKPH
ncbi:MAG: hypothetical protein GXO76_01125 [Calditrichaeota bacterium]|nr:hypothetical protein [Calditrichota bacterium]